MLIGEPGIGKSTLLAEAYGDLDDALVLRAAGAEQEMELPLAMLIQLLLPVRHLFDLVSDRHRHVLVAAIEDGDPASPVALGLAVLDLIGVLAEREALTVLVLDDAQWCDELSAATLQFAIRRLTNERVATLLAARPGITTLFNDVAKVEVTGVDLGVCRSILSVGGDVTMEVASSARDACGGNPFVLGQLGAILTPQQRAGIEPLPDIMPMGSAFSALLQQRIDALDESTLVALAVLAAAGSADRRSVTDAWAALGVSSIDLLGAERGHLIAPGPDGYQFTHPLMRSAVLSGVEPHLKRTAHRAVADALPASSVERRAHHLDLAADGPDPTVAEALEATAVRAAEQGAHEVAAVAWERAARHSMSPTEMARRLGEAGTSFWRAHRPEHGIPLSQEAVAMIDHGPARAMIVFGLGDMVAFWSDTRAGVQMLVDGAHTVHEEAPALAASMMCQAGNLAALGGDARRGVEYSRLGEGFAERADPITQIGCRALTTHLRLVHGEALDLTTELEELDVLGTLIGPDSPDELVQLGQLIVFDLMTLSRWEAADDLATRVITQAQASGLRGIESFVHGLRGEVAWRRGRWIEARAEALFEVQFHEGREDPGGAFAHATLARVEAAMGLIDDSTRNAGLVVDRGAKLGMGVLESWGLQARGLAALASGDASAAVSDLERIWKICQQGEIGEPGPLWWHGDLIEAFWRADRMMDARRFVEYLRSRALETGSTWAAAMVLRGDGLLGRNAVDLLESAERLDALNAPFEAARSRALIGEVAAPKMFEHVLFDAFDAFVALGAHPWIDRTAVIIGRQPPTVESPLDLLTKAELRVAAAVSRGLSNRDAADNLFLSPKTVDSHLQRIYRKLNVGTRTELAILVSGTSRLDPAADRAG
jgi:DNA-binding CsgD family transcriptional regulator